MDSSTWRSTAIGVLIGAGAAACLTTTAMLMVGLVSELRGNPMAPWILGRASGLTSYLLMTALVLLGLSMSHPGAGRPRRPSLRTRMRIHVSLAAFTTVFITLHVVVLVRDPFAGVGWWGAVVPMAAHYRPVAVTMGVVALWSALLAGGTAALAGRFVGRVWWPIHKIAILSFILAWAHGFAAGSDTRVLATFYLATGGTVLFVALNRYTTGSPDDRHTQLTHERRASPVPDFHVVRR